MKKSFLFTFLLLSFTTLLIAQQLSLDASFGNGGYTTVSFPGNGNNGVLNDMIITPSGKFILGGTHSTPGNINSIITLMQFNSNGTLDTAGFGNSGVVAHSFTFRNTCEGIAIQPDGKILVTGHENTSNAGSTIIPCISRFNSDGTVDYTFGDSGRVAVRFDPISSGTLFKPIVLPTGKILAIGMSSGNINGGNPGYGIMRFNSDGTLDNTFSSNGKSWVAAGVQNSMDVIVQPDGKLLIGAEDRPYPDPPRYGAARFYQNGDIDSTFGTNGKFIFPFSHNFNGFEAVTLQPDGKVLLMGTNNLGGSTDFSALRLTSTGVIDSTFGVNGFAGTTFNTNVRCFTGLVYPNGKILLGGKHPINFEDAAFAQFNPSGMPDSAFGNNDGLFTHSINQPNDQTYARKILLNGNGKLVVGGNVDLAKGFILALFDHVFTSVDDAATDNGKQLSAYPNPTDGSVRLNIPSPQAVDLDFVLTAADGRVLVKRNIHLQQGENSETLNLERFAKGIYFLHLSGSSQHRSIKIVRY